MMLNLVIIILILINLVMCSYGLYSHSYTSENYADGPAAFKKARLAGYKSQKQENYESPKLKATQLRNKFNRPSNEGYKADTRQRLQSYLKNM